jgi:hypothetical protein
MINSKIYDRWKEKIKFGTDYKYCNTWLTTKEKRLIVMNFFGEEPHGANHPVHWIFDESTFWGEYEELVRHNIVPRNSL